MYLSSTIFKKNSRFLVNFALLVILYGCNSNLSKPPELLNQEEIIQSLNKNFQANKQIKVPNWWVSFNDLLLNELVNSTLKNNPDLSIAQSNLRLAKSQEELAARSFYPSLNADSSVSKPFAKQSAYSFGLSMAWETDLLGNKHLNQTIQGMEVATSGEQLADTQLALTAETARAYVSYRQAQLNLANTLGNIKDLNETLQLTQAKQKVGLGNGLDTAQAQLSLTQVQGRIPSLEANLQTQINLLARLTGVTAESLAVRLKPQQALPQLNQALPTTIPASALNQRPDIRMASTRVKIESLKITSVQRSKYPELSLSGSLSWGAQNLEKLFDPVSLAKSWSIALGKALLDGGRNEQQVFAQQEAYAQAVQNYRKTLSTALEELANVVVSLQTINRQQATTRQALNQAKEAYHLSRSSYKVGATDFMSVLQAQQTIDSLENELTNLQGEQTQATISLYKAIGGVW